MLTGRGKPIYIQRKKTMASRRIDLYGVAGVSRFLNETNDTTLAIIFATKKMSLELFECKSDTLSSPWRPVV
jgi:hypothetical protein